ncbi:PEP-CTERM system histidine kinase PrsK [Sphingomonas piscis]|uniref:histidine kinase n=1 Tax=Sphingomonas piscis TaxID=2714943 RepID=A0A6G7YNE5_9SPHN|nr:XrtA/PEP-CTERM system histidine kinase PrsK [Sphingomonas piscis]QIK78262.1 PEP-CTERM system histidine kinase PrsK [Sphingomonas piscis]
MAALIILWSHALAAAAFAALILWRLGVGSAGRQRLLLGALAITACWCWISGLYAGSALSSYAETARNLIWVSLLYSLSARSDERQHGARLVYAAVAAVFGFQCVADALVLVTQSQTSWETAILLRMTAAAGGLVLVHNLYGQAAPTSRTSLRPMMLGLALLWAYDLNLYTVSYLKSSLSGTLIEWRGLALALTSPLFALGARNEDGSRVRLSRAATFQSLSLLAICAYFAVMAVLATATRNSGFDLSGALLIATLAALTVAGMVLLPSARARSWAKVKIAKHLFEHRYDYRTEWLRFTETLGSAGHDAPRMGERVARALADILEAPAALLLTADGAGNLAGSSSWQWDGATPPLAAGPTGAGFWERMESSGRIVEFDALRGGWAEPPEKALATPAWILEDRSIWVGVPLIHHGKLAGLVLLAAPDYRRPLDWEDFDLLRTAGRQAASSLAEAHGQEALSTAQRFEEFNRRFAFILHDVKNLVSQLSLLTRNAERHADNAEFRADMIATLKSSVGKMNDLLARLSPQAGQRPLRPEPQPLGPVLTAAIAAKRRAHDVRLHGDGNVWAQVDAAALEQAVGHLLQNAVEASPLTEPVSLRVTDRGDEIEVAITDKGCGMDGDFIRNRLFKPFASTKASGFGIGTFEARSLILAMGGRIAVDSRPGQGTTFAILLPAAPAAAEPERKIA